MNTNLSEGFLFASGALGALSLLLVIALLRNGVDGMAKIWPLLGPLLGGLMGTVTTSYFADEKVARVRAETAGQFAMVATNVEAAMGALADENNQLRAVASAGAPERRTLLGSARLEPLAVMIGEFSETARPPVAAPVR